MEKRPILERAFELTRSGECKGTDDIRVRLKAEGYGLDTDRHLSGPKLLSDLRKTCRLSFIPAT